MTVIGTGLCRKYCSQFCFEISKKTKMTITHFAFEGYCLVLLRVTEAFKRTIAHVRAILSCALLWVTKAFKTGIIGLCTVEST